MKITHVAKILLFFILASALVACGGSGNGGETTGPKTVSFWVRADDESFAKPLVQAYNSSHKDQVKLTVIPTDSFITKFGSASAAGSVPDLVAVDLVYMPSFIANNQMTDISDLINHLPYKDKLSPSHLSISTDSNGHIYASPFSAEGSLLVYNKGLFKKAGLDPEKPPTNWAEIEKDAKAITALGNDTKGYYFSGSCAGCNAFTFLPMIWASGGDILSKDYKSPTLDTPEVKAALSFYHRLWSEGLVPASAKADKGENFFAAFQTGKIGMIGSGEFSLGLLKSKNPEIDFGVTDLPGMNGDSSSFTGGDVIGVPRGSKNPEVAKDFISFIYSDNIQLNYYVKAGGNPVRTDLIDNEYSQKDPRLQTAAKALSIGRTPHTVHYNQLINDPNGPWLAMFEKAIFDGNIDGAVNTAQQQFTQILNSNS